MRIFCIAKESHIFSTKNNSIFVIFMFENLTTGPWSFRSLGAIRVIMQTCSYIVDPLTPHSGVYRGIYYFYIFALKHISWLLVKTASVSQ